MTATVSQADPHGQPDGPQTSRSSAERPRWGRRLLDPATWADYAAPTALVVVWLIFFIATPDFLTTGNISELLVESAILAVLALGQQFAVVVAGIDLSIGGNLPWSAALLGYVSSHGHSLALAIVIAIVGGLVVGVINGLLIGYLNMTDFIVTLGMLSVVSGITLLLTKGNNVGVTSTFLQDVDLDGLGPVRWFWLIALIVALVTGFLLFRTRLGTHLLAVGGNVASRSGGYACTRTPPPGCCAAWPG